jgi:uncharacterized RDD family membrane protein YckC
VTSFSEYKRRVDAGEPGLDVDSSVPKDARPYQGHRAGFVSRALAALIDVGAIVALVFAINLVIALVRVIIERVQGATLPQFGWSVVGGIILIWLGWTYAWSTTGRSLGMHIMGLKIIGYSGHRVRLPVAALRSVFCVFFPLGLIWVIFSPANRSLQDVVLRTSVVHDWVVGLPSIRTGPPPGTA